MGNCSNFFTFDIATMKFIYTFLLLACSIQAHTQTKIYVNHAATGINNGQSWIDAYSELGRALEHAAAGDSIWVATGTYYPTTGTDRDSSFLQKSGVRLYGGFSGAETSLQQRDWLTNKTILSGDIGIPGDSTDNSYTILYMDNPDSLTVLDGFVFRYGNASYPFGDFPSSTPKRNGGALYILADWEAYSLVENCIFENNGAQASGGAVYVNGAGSYAAAPTFRNCTFEHNRANADGGGIARVGNSDLERLDFENCKFIANHSGRFGGGLYYLDAEPENWIDIIGCIFEGNSAKNTGAAAALRVGSFLGTKIRIKGCCFKPQKPSVFSIRLALLNKNFLEFKAFEMEDCQFYGGEALSNINLDVLGLPDSSYCHFTKCKFTGPIPNGSYYLIGSFLQNAVFDQDTVQNIPGSTFSNISTDNTVIQNMVFENVSGLGFFYGESLVIKNNVLINSAPNGAIFYTSTSTSPSMTNCSIVDCSLNQLFNSSGSQKKLLVNNCVFYNTTLNFFEASFGNSLETLFNNCAFENDSICSAIDDEGHFIITCGPNNHFGLNPMFRDTANGDYSLLPCSPLINAGSNAAAAGILTDITGAPRIQESTVDIGAYESPAFALATTPSILPACTGAPGGAITISPTNGCEPYTFQWQPSAGNGPEITDLPPGDYIYTVTDARGRKLSDTLSIATAQPPELSPLTQNIQCGSPIGGSATVSVSNGSAPYSFLWENAATDSLRSMLPAGNYQVTVADHNGCRDSTQMTITKQGNITLMVDGEAISCFGASDAMISAAPVNGKAPFQYLWSPTGSSDSLLTGIGPGMYTVTATDFYGCTATFTFTLSDPGLLQASILTMPASSIQSPNGIATANVSGGTAPHTYAWSNSGSTMTIGGLPPGIYTVTVTDANNCSTTATAEVKLVSSSTEIADLTVQVWPNPMRERLELQAPGLPAGAYRFVLRDALGRVVAGVDVLGERAVLDVRDLAAGAYSWSLEGRYGVLARGKVVK